MSTYSGTTTSPRRLILAAVVAVLIAMIAVATVATVANAVSVGYAKVTNNDSVYLRKGANGVFKGTLYRGDHFDVQYVANGYAFGYAYGNENQCGWVAANALDNSSDSHGALHDCGPPRTLP